MILYVINYSLLIVVPLDQWKMAFINWEDWIFTQICMRLCAEHKSTVFSVHFPAKVIVAAKVCCSSCSYYDFCCKTLCFVWYKCWWLLSEASKPCQQQEHALKSKPAIRRALDLSQLWAVPANPCVSGLTPLLWDLTLQPHSSLPHSILLFSALVALGKHIDLRCYQ